jgi:hypothetical protein
MKRGAKRGTEGRRREGPRSRQGGKQWRKMLTRLEQAALDALASAESCRDP